MSYSHFLTAPPDFQFHIKAAGCYCEFEDKLLFLKRHPSKLEGNTWGIAGGKLDTNETPETAVIREVFEETGIILDPQGLENMGHTFVRRENVDMVFYRFRYRCNVLPSIKLSLEEHTEFRWVTFNDALKLPLINGGRETLLLYKDFIGRAKTTSANL